MDRVISDRVIDRVISFTDITDRVISFTEALGDVTASPHKGWRR